MTIIKTFLEKSKIYEKNKNLVVAHQLSQTLC